VHYNSFLETSTCPALNGFNYKFLSWNEVNSIDADIAANPMLIKVK